MKLRYPESAALVEFEGSLYRRFKRAGYPARRRWQLIRRVMRALADVSASGSDVVTRAGDLFAPRTANASKVTGIEF